MKCIYFTDTETLKIICSDGENFTTALDFPISAVWPTKYGLIFEKDSISSNINQMYVNFPTLFSLSHPIDEIRPVLIKSNDASINFFNDIDFKIIFTAMDDDMILFYDYKHGSHCLCLLRKVSSDELNVVQQMNETVMDSMNISNFNSRQSHDLINLTGKHASSSRKYNVSILDRKSVYNTTSTSQCSNK